MSGVQRRLLSWAVLALLLSAGTSLGAVDVTWLTKTVEIIRTRYTERDQFCAAVKIPENLVNQQNPDLEGLLSQDTDANMKDSFREEGFYAGRSVVAAKAHDEQHAEYHVLEHIQRSWWEDRTSNFLLVYTYLSPCAHRCANRGSRKNIVESIGAMASWKGHVLVFQKPYSDPKSLTPVSEEDLKAALTTLAETIGYQNILRCYKPATGAFHCVTCFSGPENTVVHECMERSGPQSGAGASRSS